MKLIQTYLTDGRHYTAILISGFFEGKIIRGVYDEYSEIIKVVDGPDAGFFANVSTLRIIG